MAVMVSQALPSGQTMNIVHQESGEVLREGADKLHIGMNIVPEVGGIPQDFLGVRLIQVVLHHAMLPIHGCQKETFHMFEMSIMDMVLVHQITLNLALGLRGHML